MSPSKQREPSIDETPEYDEFIGQLRSFHNARGTVLDQEPKVGNRRVDLLRLYKTVTEEGGYDLVSDTKNNKLAWRRLGQVFQLGNPNVPTLAFSLKSAYYKNLVAYEIKNFHNKEPPPKEILEDVSAKGGDVLGRTLENFKRPGQDASEIEDQRSPKRDKMEGEEPEGGSGRVTRGLRQAPPPRQMYQSDVSSSRGSRHLNGNFTSPAPTYNPYGAANGVHATNTVPQSLAAYEPKPMYPLTLRPVMTPGNNFDQFKTEQKRIRDASIAKKTSFPVSANRGLILPGTGFNGPNIYSRTLLALQSGILEEEEYALHHLVKISHERGDKYRFDSFPGLAEGLTTKLLGVGSLLMGENWRITYQGPAAAEGEAILDRFGNVPNAQGNASFSRKRKRGDRLEPDEFNRRLVLINEAGLVMRNMAMLEANAEYLSKLPNIRKLLVLLLSLPRQTTTNELQHNALEIAEQLTGYFAYKPGDQLFPALLRFVGLDDRGVILSGLRSICRFGTYVQQSISLSRIPLRTVQRLCSWMLIEDEELRSASLDFLYQYTAVPENVEVLLQHGEVDGLVRQLVRLLLHGARVEELKEGVRATTKPIEDPTDTPIPRISQDHVEMLLGYDEPERSTQWLRACFEEDPGGEITQIALWQAYQLPFTPYSNQRPLLPAKDFITNVSTTFSKAAAQVIQGTQPKFVIKGIKARKVPVDQKGKRFMRCLWRNNEINGTGAPDNESSKTDARECGGFALSGRAMWEHIVTTHLGLAKDADGKYQFHPSKECSCRWSTCQHFDGVAPENRNPFAVGMHVKTHLPDASDRAYQRSKHNQALDADQKVSQAAMAAASLGKRTWQTRNTAVDERSDAAGLPLTSVLVLRNLATQIPRTPSAEMTVPRRRSSQGLVHGAGDGADGSVTSTLGLMQRYFEPVREQLFEVMGCNSSLKDYLPGLMRLIDGNGRS